MFINKLVISNFKGYKSFELSFNDSVNVIVGNNNEGKSDFCTLVFSSAFRYHIREGRRKP